MKVTIGSDHGGFNLKEEIKSLLEEMKIEYNDVGTYQAEAIDYPEVSGKVAKSLLQGEADKGIIVCGTGIGVSIAANKFKGIRAALCNDVFSAQMAAEHNNANIITLGERVVGAGLAKMIVKTWLTTEFAGGRHERRVNQITALEKNLD